MGHDFEIHNEIAVAASPEEVWEAIATGPGVDSWFMGRNEVEPGEGGAVRMAFGDAVVGESRVAIWDPPHHLAYRAEPDENGGFMAFEFLIEGRDKGSTTIRWVHSGFLAGDDWEQEYDALRKGNPLYLRSLGQYLTYFRGRIAVPVTAWAPPQPDADAAWRGLCRGLGLTGTAAENDPVEFTVDGQRIAGVVDTVLYPSFLGVRTDDALYRFVGGGGMIGVGHHVFADVDPKQAEEAWLAWLAELYR